MFIAVVGITAGPSFVTGLKEVGVSLFIHRCFGDIYPAYHRCADGKLCFKFHPAITLGCTAGSRTTNSRIRSGGRCRREPDSALGYTVTYAVGNTPVDHLGVVIVIDDLKGIIVLYILYGQE